MRTGLSPNAGVHQRAEQRLMESRYPPSVFIIWRIAHQALFKTPQRENLVGRRVVPEKALMWTRDHFTCPYQSHVHMDFARRCQIPRIASPRGLVRTPYISITMMVQLHCKGPTGKVSRISAGDVDMQDSDHGRRGKRAMDFYETPSMAHPSAAEDRRRRLRALRGSRWAACRSTCETPGGSSTNR